MREPVAAQVGGREAGFTLAELLAALAVLTVGLYGLATVFAGSARVTGSAGGRTQALAIVGGELERLRAVPYGDLGLAGGDPAGSEAATGTEDLGGRSFTITRAVAWAQAGDAADERYKRVTVTVSWDEDGAPAAVSRSVVVYPGGLGPAGATTSTTVSAGAPGKPRNLRAAPTSGSESSSIDLSWGLTGNQPSSWAVQRSGDGGLTWTAVTTVTGGARAATVSGLTANRLHRFRVRGESGALASDWVYRSARTESATSSSTCILQATSVVPLVAARVDGGALAQSVAVQISTSGTCTGTYRWRVVTVPENPAAVAITGTMTRTLGLLSGTIPAATATWTAGEKLVQVVDESRSGSPVVGQATLTVLP
ncbi:MAG TPA: fibronectin type III domain-containing protein [Acidimicrobiales bacterium]